MYVPVKVKRMAKENNCLIKKNTAVRIHWQMLCKYLLTRKKNLAHNVMSRLPLLYIAQRKDYHLDYNLVCLGEREIFVHSKRMRIQCLRLTSWQFAFHWHSQRIMTDIEDDVFLWKETSGECDQIVGRRVFQILL